MAIPAEGRDEEPALFGLHGLPEKGDSALVVRCEFESREGWDWVATLKVKGARSAHEFLRLPRRVMVRELPHKPGFFELVEKRREWYRRHIVSREEAEAALQSLKRFTGPGQPPDSAQGVTKG